MGEGISNFLPLIAIIAVFYFLMIAPQMKRAKKEKKFSNELKKGDKIILAAFGAGYTWGASYVVWAID